MDFINVLMAYNAQFGHTFTSVTLTPASRAKALKQMKLALAGKRGAITEKEVNGSIPKGALI